MKRTSSTDPIYVAWALSLDGGGRVGVTFAPGKKDPSPHSSGGAWDRDLGLDLDRLKHHERVDLLVSLIEEHELRLLGIERLVEEANARDLALVRFPVRDGDVPRDVPSALALVEDAAARARDGASVVFHCRGGLGRAGTFAASALVSLGLEPREAIERVRAVRPGALETAAQERFVLALGSRH
ncbi:MAG: protein-tyrosine phosphatase family protein [Polyangiaceae bacterium]